MNFIFVFYAELHKFLEVELGTQAPVKASFVRVNHFQKVSFEIGFSWDLVRIEIVTSQLREDLRVTTHSQKSSFYFYFLSRSQLREVNAYFKKYPHS